MPSRAQWCSHIDVKLLEKFNSAVENSGCNGQNYLLQKFKFNFSQVKFKDSSCWSIGTKRFWFFVHKNVPYIRIFTGTLILQTTIPCTHSRHALLPQTLWNWSFNFWQYYLKGKWWSWIQIYKQRVLNLK